ncbi:MAG: hypothetical protein MUC68_08510 [Burkholderiaceae bacterium]|nr:hypothetical protein [Burkholderiaceae bacterium]
MLRDAIPTRALSMPAGASPKRERCDVAASRVDHPRAPARGAPDDDHALAIRHYQALTVAQASGRLDGLTARELQQVRRFEEQHRNRRTMIAAIDRRLPRDDTPTR